MKQVYRVAWTLLSSVVSGLLAAFVVVGVVCFAAVVLAGILFSLNYLYDAAYAFTGEPVFGSLAIIFVFVAGFFAIGEFRMRMWGGECE